MNNSYVIQWKSKSNGRAGRGTKQFEKEEAERLVQELNREYPQIEHSAVPASTIVSESTETESSGSLDAGSSSSVADVKSELLSPV